MKSIAYVIDCMYNSGGMERVLTVCTSALSYTYNITIVTAFQQGRPDYFKINPQVRRHDLKIDENTISRKKKTEYKKRLSVFLSKEHFDVVISLGGMDLDFLHSIHDGSRKILWFHFAIDIAETTWVGTNSSLISRIKAKLRTRKRIYHARKYDKIVVISNVDLVRWKKYTRKAELIYNPVTINSSQLSDGTSKTVISVGRLDYQKGYDYLIDAWLLVFQKHSDWNLYIYGEGPMRNNLQKQINELKLSQSITLCGRKSQIENEYPQHSIFVMSSRAEGMPLVLLEASSCGLPLIAFDCPSGPSEIIEDGKNGFLIKDIGDVQAMADRICQLIENKELRRQMGYKVKEMVDKFNIVSICEQWKDLLG